LFELFNSVEVACLCHLALLDFVAFELPLLACHSVSTVQLIQNSSGLRHMLTDLLHQLLVLKNLHLLSQKLVRGGKGGLNLLGCSQATIHEALMLFLFT
jgi:hypothetical protein